MKNTLLVIIASTLVLSTAAHAGINGTYQVSGFETEDGETYSLTGTLKVSKYKSATYSFSAGDGTTDSFTVKFSKPLKEVITRQTVTASNSEGIATAVFTRINGKNFVKFTYRSKDGSVRGSGSGSK